MGSRLFACALSCVWILLLITLVPPCSPEATVASVDVHAAMEYCNSTHRYLDVRTADEFNRGHPLQGGGAAINVPYMFFTPEGRVKNKDFVDEVTKVCSKDDHIVVGCASGVRSLKATADLLDAGFKHAKNMEGGYAAWTENGFAVKKSPSLM